MAEKDFRVKLGIEVGANANIAGSITSVDSVQLDLENPVTDLATGQFSWNEDSNTVSVGLNVGSLELGQEEHLYIKNQSGNTIGKGNTVMFAGTLGSSGRILGTKAVTDGTYPSSYFIGIAKHDIATGEDGYVTTFGKVDQVDTSMFSEGDILYADPGVVGGLSNTAPVAPNNYITAAAVINSDLSNGVLFVRPTFEGSLADKEDVYAPSVSNNNTLVWSSANSRFEAKTLTAADVEAVATSDIGTTVLSYDSNLQGFLDSFTLPTVDGANNQVITTDGAGNLSFADVSNPLELYAENPSSPTAPNAAGTNSIAIGDGMSAGSSATGGIAIGQDGTVSGVNSVSLGKSGAYGTGSFAAAISSVSYLTYGADGNYSISVGYRSRASSTGAIAIGYEPKALNNYATAISRSYASGTDSFAAAIATNSSSYGATGTNSVAIGQLAKATTTRSIAIGGYAQSTGSGSVAIGGQGSGSEPIASGSASIAIGAGVRADAAFSMALGSRAQVGGIRGKQAWTGYAITGNNDGASQSGKIVLAVNTTDATPAALTTYSTPNATNQIILPNNSAYAFHGTIVAREQASAGTDCAAWKIEGLIRREGSAGTTVLVNSATTVIDNTPSWGLALSADTTNGGLKIEVTGAAATNIRWVATVHTSEVTY